VPNDAGRPGQQPSDVVDIYDSTNDSWSVARLSFADSSPRAVTVGTQVLIESVAGPNAGKVDVFDSTTRSIAPMQLGRPAGAATRIVAGSSMLVMRKFQGPGIWSLDEPLDLYDSRRSEWSTLSLPTPRRKVGVAAVGPLLLFAGGEVDGQPVDTVDMYDTRTGGWSSAALSTPSSSAAGLTIGRRALFFGDTVDVFDGATGTWSTTTPPVPLKGEPTVRGTVAVWSLSTTWSEHDPAPQVVMYESDRNAWHVGTLSVPRANYSIATVGTRVLFAGGGQEGEGKPHTLKEDLKVVDIYDLATQTWSQGQLQKGRETIHTTTVAEKALFIGGFLGCNSCSVGGVGLIVDIYDASAG
jgi:hypothetical protein